MPLRRPRAAVPEAVPRQQRGQERTAVAGHLAVDQGVLRRRGFGPRKLGRVLASEVVTLLIYKPYVPVRRSTTGASASAADALTVKYDTPRRSLIERK